MQKLLSSVCRLRAAPDFTIVEVSGDLRPLVGWSSRELIGHRLYELAHPSDLGEMRLSHEAWLRSPLPQSRQYRIRHKQGGYVWIESDRRSVLDDAGRIIGAEAEWRRLDAIPELRRIIAAIEGSELVLHYQPIVRADDGALMQLEALARWPHDGRIAPPSEFIPFAEQSGIIRPLTQWALAAALRDLGTLRAQGVDTSVAVNISPRDVVDPLFAADVAAKLSMADVDPSRLILELTETAVAEVDPHVDACLHQLAATGVALAIDDFGSGQSSIGRIAALPIRELKVDRSLTTDPAGYQQLFGVVAALGRDRGFRVIAEGVETHEQMATLRALGITEMQGWAIAHAMPVEDVAGWRSASDAGRPVLF